MFFAGSRFASLWLFPYESSRIVDLQGSPLDRAIFFILIMSGIFILLQRKLNWIQIVSENKWVFLFFLFGLISISWSDFPFVSLKRWIKALGNLIMVLVILTDKQQFIALGIIFRRLSFLLIPLSALYIKYYPELGRAYHMGEPMFVGVSTQKNGLGLICLTTGLYYFWELLFVFNKNSKLIKRRCYVTYLLILPITFWLFNKADSATSLGCMLVAICILALSKNSVVAKSPSRILKLLTTSIFLFLFLEYSFDITNTVITLLGREPDLTTRVPFWHGLLGMVKNPIIGFGFESFWLGQRSSFAKEIWGISGQAHNGYLQVYLDLGIIGILILSGCILSGLRKVARHLTFDYSTGILRLCFIGVALLYNWTEATFYGVSNMWILLLLGIMDISKIEKGDNLS
jgi:exopolysaccharide production protein ExoQ